MRAARRYVVDQDIDLHSAATTPSRATALEAVGSEPVVEEDAVAVAVAVGTSPSSIRASAAMWEPDA